MSLISRLYNWVNDKNAGINITASRQDSEFDALITGVNNSLHKDGTITATGNLPMGTKKITGLGDGTAAQDAVTMSQLQDDLASYALDSGAADVYVLALSPTLAAYSTGMQVVMKVGAGNTNTGASTVNIDSLGAKSIKKHADVDPDAGDLEAAGIYHLRYDGTNFQLLSMISVDPDDTYASLTANQTISGDNTLSGDNTQSGTLAISGALTVTGTTTVNSALNYLAASGTNTYTATLSPALTSYVTGAQYNITITNASTSTTPTLNLNSLGAKTIKKEGGTALISGDMPAKHAAIFRYDGTDMILLNPAYVVKFLQVVNVEVTSSFSRSGSLSLSGTKVTFTKKSATSDLIVMASVYGTCTSGSTTTYGILAVTQDGGSNYVGTMNQSARWLGAGSTWATGSAAISLHTSYTGVAAGSVTIEVGIGGGGGNYTSSNRQLIVMEIEP